MKRKTRIVAFLLVICLMTGFLPSVRADGELTVSQELVDVLKTMEGFAAKPYWDYKQWTVGYGSLCPDAPSGPEGTGGELFNRYMESGIPLDEAEQLLRQELNRFEVDVRRFMNTHSLQLKQQEYDALVSFSYNCGSGWMSSGYMQRAVLSGARGSAFLYAMTLYSKAGGEYILQERRLCEANMYLNGVYRAYNSGDGAIPDNYRYVFLEGNGGTVKYGIFGFDTGDPPVISVEMTAPTGQMPDGTPYAYTLEGWYTADGRKVEKPDSTLESKTILYANWTDYEGKPVSLVKGQSVAVEVTVTAENADIRPGPALFYPEAATAPKGEKLWLTQLYNGWGLTSQGWVALTDTDYTGVPVEPRGATVTGSKVNYRNGPSTSGTTVVGQKYAGDRITVVKIDYSQDPAWGQMDDGYWIRLDFVQLDEDPAQPKPVMKGDLTGDEIIDSLDGLLLLRHLNGWNVTIAKPDAMDVNADGKVDSLDGLILLRYLNGWNVQLK